MSLSTCFFLTFSKTFKIENSILHEKIGSKSSKIEKKNDLFTKLSNYHHCPHSTIT